MHILFLEVKTVLTVKPIRIQIPILIPTFPGENLMVRGVFFFF